MLQRCCFVVIGCAMLGLAAATGSPELTPPAQGLAAAHAALSKADAANPAEQAAANERLFDRLDEAGRLDSDEARALVESVLTLRSDDAEKESVAYALALERKARVECAAYHLADAVKDARLALALLQKNGGDAEADATVRATLGHALVARQTQLDEAVSLLEAVIVSLDARHVVDLRLAVALRDLSFADMLLGKLDRSQAAVDRASAVAAALAGPGSGLQAEALIVEAYIPRARGDFAAAIGMLEHALQILGEAKPPRRDAQARALLSLAQTQRTSGNLKAATQRDLECIALEQGHPSFGGVFLAGAHNDLGLILHADEHEAEAIPHLESAHAIYRTLFGADAQAVLVTENNLALAYRGVGRLDEAVALFQHEIEVGEKNRPPPGYDYPIELVNLGDTYMWQGRYAEAEQLYRRYLARIGPGHDVGEIEPRGALSGLSASLLGEGREREAFAAAQAAERSRQKLVRTAGSDLGETHAVGLAQIERGGLDWAVAIAAKTQRADEVREAWRLLMDSNGMITTLSARRLAVARASNDAKLAAVWKDWKERDEALVQARVAAARDPAQATSDALDTAEQKFDVAERALAHAEGANGAALDNARAGLPAVLAALPADGMLVSYFFANHYRPQDIEAFEKDLPGRLFAFVGRRNTAPRLFDLGPQPAISEAAQQWLDTIIDHRRDAAARTAAGQRLRALIWDPIATQYPEQRVFVIPSRQLQRIPFAALPAGDGRYLVETGYMFHLLDHERDMLGAPAPADQPTLSLIGAPDFSIAANEAGTRGTCAGLRGAVFSTLPQAAREIDELRALWSQRTGASTPAVLTGTDATEARARAVMGKSRIIHFATHGLYLGDACDAEPADSRGLKNVDTAKPVPEAAQDLSALVLSGANRPATSTENDGLLTSEEIAALDLTGTDWAVLSACDTGIGRNVLGEGVFGLRRAFRLAGAHSVIMSLWPVSDAASADWMVALYRARLQQQATTIDAVRAADLALIKQRRDAGLDPAPFYWAAFVAAGDWR